MKKQKGFSSLIGIVIIVAVAVVAVGGVFGYQYLTTPKENNQQQNQNTENTIDSTADRKTYTNDKYGFSFNYSLVGLKEIPNESSECLFMADNKDATDRTLRKVLVCINVSTVKPSDPLMSLPSMEAYISFLKTIKGPFFSDEGGEQLIVNSEKQIFGRKASYIKSDFENGSGILVVIDFGYPQIFTIRITSSENATTEKVDELYSRVIDNLIIGN